MSNCLRAILAFVLLAFLAGCAASGERDESRPLLPPDYEPPPIDGFPGDGVPDRI